MKKILFLLVIILFQCKASEKNKSVGNLENTYWKLSEMNGMPVMTAENKKEVHFILTNSEGKKGIKGFAGCNNLGGSYTLKGNKIKFTPITTKMLCEKEMETEDFFTKALSSADSYKINGEELELYEGETFLAKFQSVYLK